jgi:hypothetical protein
MRVGRTVRAVTHHRSHDRVPAVGHELLLVIAKCQQRLLSAYGSRKYLKTLSYW